MCVCVCVVACDWVCVCVCVCVCGVCVCVLAVPKLIQKIRERGSDDLHLVVDAYELALTSRFPPTRQLVGNDVRFVARVLWNLPAPVTDWFLHRLTAA